MLANFIAVLLASASGNGAPRAAHVGWNSTRTRYTLHNGWRLTPVGKSVKLPGDMPGNILLVDGGRKALVDTSGFHDHSLNLVDLSNGKIVSSVPFEHSWIGLAVVNGSAWVSGGLADDTSKYESIHRVGIGASGLTAEKGLNLEAIPAKERFVSSILSGRQGVYVLNIQTDELLRLAEDGSVRAKGTVGYRPYGLALNRKQSTLAVSEWGDESVALLDPATLALRKRVKVQSHPTAMAFGPDGRLFVSNAGANTVSVIEDGRVVETIRTGIDHTGRIGSTPVALALSPNGRTLYVANAGNNCVTVVDVAGKASRVLGYIPTDKYPTAIATTPDGKRLLVATAKGMYAPNAGKGVDLSGDRVRGRDLGAPFQYVGEQLTGRLAIVDVPTPKVLARYTKQVLDNAPLGERATVDVATRKAIQKGAFAKIKHVIYVIKENRSYDQVFGDIPKGNGDPSLTLFGRKVTPNEHKIVNQFVLFDNLYTDGEVSQCGHQWTDAAYANDYNEKQWILNYSDRGEVNSDTRLTSSPGDYIWSHARKKGLWARVYGEYVDVQEDHDSLQPEAIKKNPEKYGYSASFEKIFARGGRDTEKVADFLREMHTAEKTGKWPSLMVMALPEDHTRGLSAGKHTPYAMVGSNDRAVGQLVDAVSHSRFWKDTAIFIIEDDAQAGPDHVDSHRTTGMVVSPYIRRGAVDSTMYATSSMLRTMELILGLTPMTQYDAKATPMYAAFTTKPDFAPYSLAPAGVDLDERNPAGTLLAQRSAKLDWSDIDRADFNELNHILWEAYRPGVPYPAPVRGW